MYRKFGKRAVDLALCCAAMVILSPLLMVAAFGTWVALGAPVLFVQTRPGLRGKPFKLYKFRTMSDSLGPDGKPLADELRLNAWGRFVRGSSLDELPELINVILGHMSLVGPRPLLMSYLDRYDAEQLRRHDVLPGITGWAQVNGRNEVPWKRRLAMDVWYVDHLSLALDVRILLRTVGEVFRHRGIHAEGAATMPEFQGVTNDHR